MDIIEEYLRIEGSSQNGIYGKIRSSGQDSLIFHIHGMTHNINGMLEVTSADFFTKHGYDHYRLGFYERAKDSKTLANSTLSTHVQDIEAALEYFKSRYKNIYITAHSLGALCMLILNPKDVKAMSLWDPATDITNFWKSAPYLEHMPERKEYKLNYGNIFIIGEELVEEIKCFPDEKCLQLAAKTLIPTQMIIPQETIFSASAHISPENYRDVFLGQFSLNYIDGANHTFSNQGNQTSLFNETLAWFSQHR